MWWVWLIVAAIGAATFGLGMYTSLVFNQKHEADIGRVNAAFGIALMVIALIVVVDIVYLQVDYRRFADRARVADQEQITCNRQTLQGLMRISAERRKVDEQAKDFDVALRAWLHSGRLQDDFDLLDNSLDNVIAARQDMMKVYDSVDYPACNR